MGSWDGLLPLTPHPVHHPPTPGCLEYTERCHSVPKGLLGLSQFQGSQAWRSSSSLALLCCCLCTSGSITLLTLLFAPAPLCKPNHRSLGPKGTPASLVGALLFSSSSFALTHQLLLPAAPGHSPVRSLAPPLDCPNAPLRTPAAGAVPGHQGMEQGATAPVQPAECCPAAHSPRVEGTRQQ